MFRELTIPPQHLELKGQYLVLSFANSRKFRTSGKFKPIISFLNTIVTKSSRLLSNNHENYLIKLLCIIKIENLMIEIRTSP